MHMGGERMILRLNGKEICNSVARYGDNGEANNITDISLCNDVVPVKKGDHITFESVYNLGAHFHKL